MVWHRAVKAAGAPVETHFHELRHYYASLLIRHGGHLLRFVPAELEAWLDRARRS